MDIFTVYVNKRPASSKQANTRTIGKFSSLHNLTPQSTLTESSVNAYHCFIKYNCSLSSFLYFTSKKSFPSCLYSTFMIIRNCCNIFLWQIRKISLCVLFNMTNPTTALRKNATMFHIGSWIRNIIIFYIIVFIETGLPQLVDVQFINLVQNRSNPRDIYSTYSAQVRARSGNEFLVHNIVWEFPFII